VKRLVLDTNVLVSGIINAFGAPGRIVDLVREGEVQLVVDDRILLEYREVLGRPKFRPYFSAREAGSIVQFLQHNTLYTVPAVSVTDLPDQDDVPFLEVALAADVPLVTGNTDDFPADCRRSVEVLTPAECLRRLSK
jgi:putative PIN family toxin of toxin-antitoxin system